ncbi:MAG: hypothetical protein JNN04_12045 [Cyclobacteriaceae bacterium]|nr:hypothetical protein [Cyclobacteriaceae bacterium]
MENKPAERLILGNLKNSEKFPDNLVSGAICLDVLSDKRIKLLTYEYQGRKYLNVKVVKRKKATEYGKTHYIEVDTFVPKTRERVADPEEEAVEQ